ncbi:sulfite reductase subunit alpha [Massilia litorea]|uniref:NADPH--hemoprotein reductase n=1 Tax=Massilia litorea TaxID=2769491 RepID=A0A7L9TYT8_9BURK|nr:sulfite reductase subunit alpha [Massilia litorea]QOL47868.1 flavodoxin domain-containing protein [Massilia litorea]
MMLTLDPVRWGSALALVAAWGGLCAAMLRRATPAVPDGDADWLVVYASQTGNAEYLARQTAATLATGGLSARALSIEDLDAGTLAGTTRALFIASTYGEGDSPDAAARFAGVTMAGGADLSQLHYAVLALGDSSYTHFCGFGRALDGWLTARGATPLFARIDVDRGNAEAIAGWQHQLSHLAGTSDLPDWEAPAYGQWRILERTLLNEGSAGAPLYRIALIPAEGALPDWEAGDLVQIRAPRDPDLPREYSIASVPGEGRIELLVRLQGHADGSLGAASGWLCLEASGSDTISLRIRAHARFRLGDNAARPLILVGNGTGLAGLRAHLKARIDAGVADNWLVFGERNARADFLCRDELERWRDAGRLARLDTAFSRDGAEARYVQHVLAEQAAEVRAWIARGAAVYVCGSLQGMASGVHEALAAALGADALDELAAQGRYRRDVY